MASSVTSTISESANAWLWQDLILADVSLTITLSTPNTPEGSSITESDADTDVNDNADPISASAIHSMPNSMDTHIETTGIDGGASAQQHQQQQQQQQQEQQQLAIPPITKTYLLHSQVLGSSSSFFRTILTSAVGINKRKRSLEEDGCRWQISAQVDVDAGTLDAVLEFFYKQQLSDTLLGPELLSIMKIADTWQANGLLTATANKLLGMDATLFPLSACFSLPPVLKAATAFASVMAHAEEILLATFGNAQHVITTPALLHSLLSLPLPALFTLLNSPKLETDSEESVLLLVSGWCGEPTGQACSADQIYELHSLIRYSRLSPPYLSGLCDSSNLPELTRKQLMELFEFHSLPSEDLWVAECSNNPSPWYLPPRPTPAQQASHINLSLAVTIAKLKSLLAGISQNSSGDNAANVKVASSRVYAGGFLWRLNMSLQHGDLCSVVTVEGVFSVKAMDQGVEVDHGVRCEGSIQIEAPERFLLYEFETLVHTAGCGMRMTGPIGLFEEAADFNWWARFVVDGAVRLAATVKRI